MTLTNRKSCWIKQGVENVYTQHTPHLAETIENLLRARLKETSYPFIDGQNVNTTNTRP